jgi:ribosome-binding factor A
MTSKMSLLSILLFALLQFEGSAAFSNAPAIRQQQTQAHASTALFALYSQGRSSSRTGKPARSKRQERVGQFVQTELARILHSGNIKGDSSYLDAELRKRISIVNVDVAPDLRQARISCSVRASITTDDNPVVDKRRAYSWLVKNTTPLRHTLAQKMSHMKTSPSLTFVQVDLGAAVDVMYLIDKVTKGLERDTVGEFGGDDNNLPKGYVSGMDFDEEFKEDEWEEDDDGFF